MLNCKIRNVVFLMFRFETMCPKYNKTYKFKLLLRHLSLSAAYAFVFEIFL